MIIPGRIRPSGRVIVALATALSVPLTLWLNSESRHIKQPVSLPVRLLALHGAGNLPMMMYIMAMLLLGAGLLARWIFQKTSSLYSTSRGMLTAADPQVAILPRESSSSS